MKHILLSIRPQWVKKILNGDKTIEVRKTAPKCELPCEVYIYCTKDQKLGLHWAKEWACVENTNKTLKECSYNGLVVAKFTLNKVGNFNKKSFGTYEEPFTRNQTELLEKSCLTEKELDDYLKGNKGYAWHIDHLVPFDRPKELKDFGVKRSPQSWQFIEVEE